MLHVLDDFARRCDEVESYLNLVVDLDEKKLVLGPGRSGATAPPKGVYDGLLKTLKASVYLLLYNLVESTMRNAIKEIFDHLESNAVSIDKCRDELQAVVLKMLRKRNPGKLVPFQQIAVEMISEAFNPDELFSGNVDGREIRKTSERYGIEDPVRGCRIDKVLVVKNKRNDLAHGISSFADIGRDSAPSELREAYEQVEILLKNVLDKIQRYLDEQQYLRRCQGFRKDGMPCRRLPAAGSVFCHHHG